MPEGTDCFQHIFQGVLKGVVKIDLLSTAPENCSVFLLCLNLYIKKNCMLLLTRSDIVNWKKTRQNQHIVRRDKKLFTFYTKIPLVIKFTRAMDSTMSYPNYKKCNITRLSCLIWNDETLLIIKSFNELIFLERYCSFRTSGLLYKQY